MKTRDFVSDAEVFSLVAAFEAATIPAAEFTHVAHIAVAVSYLAELSRDQALERTYDVDPSRRRSPQRPKADLPLWQRINSIVARWGTSAPVKAHYSRELISSKAARSDWIPPDLLPLPF